MKSKQELRKEILYKRSNLDEYLSSSLSNTIIDKLLLLDIYKNSKIIMPYVDFKNEVNTKKSINTMLKTGKRVVIPYTDIENVEIIPVEIKNLEKDTTYCKYGYLEPKKENIIPFSVDDIDIILIPGVAFDKKLNRIGFGKGYYDKLLANKNKHTKIIALAYEFQIFKEIPHDNHDIKMDMIITEKNIYEPMDRR